MGGILTHFAWTVILATAVGVAASFTPLRKLEGVGASRIGSLFLYLLVASIGARAEFRHVFDEPGLLLIAAAWITFHAISLLILRWLLKCPIFFLAVGSRLPEATLLRRRERHLIGSWPGPYIRREGPQTGWPGPRPFQALRMAEARKVWVNQNRGPLTRSDTGAFPGLNI